jgi:hypothetical protein
VQGTRWEFRQGPDGGIRPEAEETVLPAAYPPPNRNMLAYRKKLSREIIGIKPLK